MLGPAIRRWGFFAVLLHAFLNQTGYTDADIFAERTIAGNSLSVMALDFSVTNSFNDGAATNLFQVSDMEPGGFDLGAIRIRTESGAGFKYRMKAVRTNGDDAFCGALGVKMLGRDFSKSYDGPLLGLSEISSVPSDDRKDRIFSIGLNGSDPSLRNKICEFDLDIRTYQEHPDERGGIFAERSVRNIVASGNW